MEFIVIKDGENLSATQEWRLTLNGQLSYLFHDDEGNLHSCLVDPKEYSVFILVS